MSEEFQVTFDTTFEATKTTLSENAHPESDRLSFTVFMALALHALVIFGVTFVVEPKGKPSPTLNITLATHSASTAPDKADFLAEHNQEASGSLDTAREQTSTSQAEINDLHVNQVSPNVQASTPAQQDNTVKVIHTKRGMDQLADKSSEKQTKESDKQEQKLEVFSAKFASLRAQLDKIKNEQAKRPRVRRLTSVATKASVDAAYLHKWTEKIERIGNTYFPQQAIEQKIFGQLRLVVSIKPNGQVNSVEILQSSGHSILDNAAKQIVRLAAPFQPFPEEIKRQADHLEIIRTWRFDISGLSTSQNVPN